MLDNIFRRVVSEDFIVIDSRFPQKEPMGFRNAEFNEYLSRLVNFSCYASYPIPPRKPHIFNHTYGISKVDYLKNLDSYARSFPDNVDRINWLDPRKRYKIKLAYVIFLSAAYSLLEFFEKNKVPFIFVLYPGGSFGLNNEKSDMMLREVFESKYFRGVIVTQKITRDYLIDNKLCPDSKISFIYGGFVQFGKSDVVQKKYYKKDKKTFDVCFVGHKYLDKGVDKGYDLFIETARLLSKTNNDIRFHVIGGFGPGDIDLGESKDRIKFYGVKPPKFLRMFYSKMDILLSPNRPFQHYVGNFDGFPIGADAGYCGVARLVSDELNMNTFFQDGKDIVLIPLNPYKISETIMQYYNNPNKLYKLSKKGQEVTQELWDIDRHVKERLNIFSKITEIQLKVKKETVV